MTIKKSASLVLAIILSVGLIGCDTPAPPKAVPDKVIEDNKVKEDTKDAVDEIKDGAENIKDKAEDKIDDMVPDKKDK